MPAGCVSPDAGWTLSLVVMGEVWASPAQLQGSPPPKMFLCMSSVAKVISETFFSFCWMKIPLQWGQHPLAVLRAGLQSCICWGQLDIAVISSPALTGLLGFVPPQESGQSFKGLRVGETKFPRKGKFVFYKPHSTHFAHIHFMIIIT